MLPHPGTGSLSASALERVWKIISAICKPHFAVYFTLIRIKFPTNWDSQLKKSLFQTRLEAAVSASAAAQKDQQNQAVVVVIISAATAIIISAASQKDQDPENAATVSVSAPEIKQSVSIASIVASAVTSIVTSTVPFASAVCSSDITHWSIPPFRIDYTSSYGMDIQMVTDSPKSF